MFVAEVLRLVQLGLKTPAGDMKDTLLRRMEELLRRGIPRNPYP